MEKPDLKPECSEINRQRERETRDQLEWSAVGFDAVSVHVLDQIAADVATCHTHTPLSITSFNAAHYAVHENVYGERNVVVKCGSRICCHMLS